MDLLEHPLEAVAFRLYSLPEASAATGAAAAWTCLAAFLAAAAAAGIWRLRSSAPTSVTTTDTAAAMKPLEIDPRPAEEVLTAASSSPETATAASSAAPSPKERYTAYYSDACRIGCCEDDGDDERGREDDAEERDGDGEDAGVVYGAPPETTKATVTDPFGWEGEVVRSLPLSPTAAELGLGSMQYRCLTPLGGSVVQLWDHVAGGGSTPTASPRRRSRGLATAVPGF
ncbi:hypothetical protein HU200_015567 [Digitaria exilis]|uniref:Uncharacterized protein n=1 Tax=Digitaria exilis TaxID=1010633 RepID=A0A835FB66_9POAL|nr:hypothetical protein HU200_015567 [Digitaria exilis]CAB3469867.1 unnamed protein product [Digitaria exilis]